MTNVHYIDEKKVVSYTEKFQYFKLLNVLITTKPENRRNFLSDNLYVF